MVDNNLNTKSLVIKRLFLCLLSAFLLILSFPNFNLWVFAWFGFVPLFFAIKDKPKGKAFLLSYLTGVIFWLGIIYWLIHVTLPGMIFLVLYLALYFGLFGLTINYYGLRTKNYELLFVPLAWIILEYLRSHLFTGFPWALLGYSQYLNLPVIQIADITGVLGVSFLVMMVNVFVYKAIAYKLGARGKRGGLVLPFLIIFLSLGYGFYKLNQTPDTRQQTPLKISVIQGNIPQELKWDIGSREFIIDKYLTLTRQAIKDEPALIIWPEAALPVVLEEEPQFFKRVEEFVKDINTPLLLGAVTLRNSYYNSALLLSRKGRILNRYDKLHLVPFGEYIPLRKILSFLDTVVPIGDFAPGRELTVFQIPDYKSKITNRFSVLICFEDLFPALARGFAKKGAQFLVNITNDAWFGRTSSPFQHLGFSVFRAIENRRFIIRCANTGLSCFIDSAGRVKPLPIFIEGAKTEPVYPQNDITFYARYGDLSVLLCLVLVICGIMVKYKR